MIARIIETLLALFRKSRQPSSTVSTGANDTFPTPVSQNGGRPAPVPDTGPATDPTPWMPIARREIGQREIPGAGSNKRIEAYFTATAYGAADDSVPWCGAFVAWCLREAGVLRGKGSARAADWASWGERLPGPKIGCIVVLKPQGVGSSGHVGFLAAFDAAAVTLLGGNQANAANEARFPRNHVRQDGWRWPQETTMAVTTPAAPPLPTMPRGIRNRNPGNLSYSSQFRWPGLVGPEPGPNSRFAVFETMAHGIAQIDAQLGRYVMRGIDTPRKMIAVYAPAHENDTESYIRAVSSGVGLGADTPVDRNDHVQRRALVRAIVLMECGRRGYDMITETDWRAGFEMAGIA